MKGLKDAWAYSRSLKALLVIYVLALGSHSFTLIGVARGAATQTPVSSIAGFVLSCAFIALIAARYRTTWVFGLAESAYAIGYAIYIATFERSTMLAATLEATKDSALDEATRQQIMQSALVGGIALIVAVAILKAALWYYARPYFKASASQAT
jgi:hypothetical protein